MLTFDVLSRCPVKKALRPVQVTDQGKIKRIRGVASDQRRPTDHRPSKDAEVD